MNIYDEKCTIWDGNICTGQSPPGTLHVLIYFLARSQSIAPAPILHLFINLSLQEMSDFSYKTNLAYVSANISILAPTHSVSVMQPTERLSSERSIHAFALADVPENESTTS